MPGGSSSARGTRRSGVCLDSFHILARGTSLDEIAAIPPDKLFMLQLADAPRLRMDELQWSRHFRCFPGQGAFDLESFLARVLAAGYAGPLSLEIFNDIFRQADPFRTAVDGRRSLLWLEERVSAPGQENRPDSGRRLPGTGGGLRGFAFVELNAPPETARALERLLAGLGLRRTGQHRSKPVELWEAGDARILVNSGRRRSPPPGGSPSPPSASTSPTRRRSLSRATALRAPLVPRHRNWDEADLVAIEAPDGVEIFLCEEGSDWRGDFDPCPDEHPFGAKARLTGIDHVALAQPLTLFHESVLFYRSLLGLVPLETPGAGVAERPDQEPGAHRRGSGRDGQAGASTCPCSAADAPGNAWCSTSRSGRPTSWRRPAQSPPRDCPCWPCPATTTRTSPPGSGSTPPSLETYRRLNILYDEDSAGRVMRHCYVTSAAWRRAVRDHRPGARVHGLRSGERARTHGRPGNQLTMICGE